MEHLLWRHALSLGIGVLVVGLTGCAFDRAPEGGAVLEDVVDEVFDPADVSSPDEDSSDVAPMDVPDALPFDVMDANEDAIDEDLVPSNLRVVDGLLALYLMESFADGTVPNAQGASEFDLALVSGEVLPVAGYGATMLQASRVLLEDSSTLIEALRERQAFSFEVWCRPHNITQGGPARILGVEDGPFSRNMLLGQAQESLALRLRVGEEPSPDSIFIPDAFSAETPTHIVLTFDGEAQRAEVYVNGAATPLSLPDAATLEFWGLNHQMTLWDTNTGERPWSGDLHLAAVYGRALSPDEVETNFEAGVTGFGLPSPLGSVRVEALTEVVLEEEGAVGRWKITRRGDTDEPLEVSYRLIGSAQPEIDYLADSATSVTIPAGETFVEVAIEVLRDEAFEGEEVVTLQLLPAGEVDLQEPRKAAMVLRDAEQTPPSEGLLRWLSADRVPSLLGERVEQWPDIATGSPVAVGDTGSPAMLIEQDGRAMRFDGGSAYPLAPDDGIAVDDGMVFLFVMELDDDVGAEFAPFFSLSTEEADVPFHFLLSTRQGGRLKAQRRGIEDGEPYVTVFNKNDVLDRRALVTLSFRVVLGSLFRVALRVDGEALFDNTVWAPGSDTWRHARLGHVRSGGDEGARVLIRELLFYGRDARDFDLEGLERELMARHGL